MTERGFHRFPRENWPVNQVFKAAEDLPTRLLQMDVTGSRINVRSFLDKRGQAAPRVTAMGLVTLIIQGSQDGDRIPYRPWMHAHKQRRAFYCGQPLCLSPTTDRESAQLMQPLYKKGNNYCTIILRVINSPCLTIGGRAAWLILFLSKLKVSKLWLLNPVIFKSKPCFHPFFLSVFHPFQIF